MLSTEQKEAVFMQKIAQIDERIADLHAIRSYLLSKIARLHGAETEADVPETESVLV